MIVDFDTFCVTEGFTRSDLTLNSIFAKAIANGYIALTVPVSVDSITIAPVKETSLPEIPAHLLTIPSVLGQAVDWINHNARKPQPVLAVQAALAFGATVMGRRYVAKGGIVPSLYLLNVAESGAGKEDARRAVERLLDASGLERLIGNSGYSSAAGVLSALIQKPSHFTAIDEFGMMLEQAKNSGNNNGASVISQIMTVYGQMNDVLRPMGYSTHGLSKESVDAMEARKVIKPALSLIGLTTPESFFNAVGSAGIKNGFLNRFITVISEQGYQVTRFNEQTPAPFDVVNWAQDAANNATGNLSGVEATHDLEPLITVIDVSIEARNLYRQFEEELVVRISPLRAEGLHEMMTRLSEMAMRIALIVCVSNGESVITAAHYAWARDYVDIHSQRMIAAIRELISDSVNEAVEKDIIRVIQKAINDGKQGLTMSQIARVSRKFSAIAHGQREQVINWLVKHEQLAMIESAANSPSKAMRYTVLAQFDGE